MAYLPPFLWIVFLSLWTLIYSRGGGIIVSFLPRRLAYAIALLAHHDGEWISFIGETAMELFVMRHADAVDGTTGDFSRGLSEKGRGQAEKMGEWLRRLALFPMVIVSSPYPRAYETARVIAERLGGGTTVQPDERLSSGMTVEAGCALVHELGRSGLRLMLVGHAPDLSLLSAYLLGAKEGSFSLRKGGVGHFEVGRAGFGGGTLRWLIDPRL